MSFADDIAIREETREDVERRLDAGGVRWKEQG